MTTLQKYEIASSPAVAAKIAAAAMTNDSAP
jgi:hypothetical protein